MQGFPGTGSLSRGAVNNASGARTPLGGLYTGALVIAALFMTPLFYYIPKAALASIIIAAIIFMVEVRVVKPMWRSKSEFVRRFKVNDLWSFKSFGAHCQKRVFSQGRRLKIRDQN